MIENRGIAIAAVNQYWPIMANGDVISRRSLLTRVSPIEDGTNELVSDTGGTPKIGIFTRSQYLTARDSCNNPP